MIMRPGMPIPNPELVPDDGHAGQPGRRYGRSHACREDHFAQHRAAKQALA
jgi:hypothetical protein